MSLEETLTLINYICSPFNLVYGLFSFFTSTLLLYICLTKCDTKSTEIRLIFIFCFIEYISGIEFFFLGLMKLIYGHGIFAPNNLTCKFTGFLILWTTRVDIISVSILATLRYLIVCHKKEVKLLYWLITLFLSFGLITIIYCLGIYTNDSGPSPSYLYCQPFTSPGMIGYVVSIIIPFAFIIPCWLTTFCYFSVGWEANKQLNNMKQEAINTGDSNLLRAITNQKIKLVTQLILVFVLYNVNFSLSYVTWILRFAIGYKRPPEMDAVISVSANFTIAINPVITIIFQPDINNEVKFFFVKMSAKYKSILNRINIFGN
ncbi:hypothetical protein CONCODRAFT_13241 [Conidiobolus coronatus NRRL 28638]|uniref:G-protein coupled receptors family 1 profile domain-containing protein n=1 Tax=Conidiobolus coronatus (strain ATCC 28846 / CBS 209.66 / NRRL 28638) TaxID=796925 RepID=A0A137NRC5_CONC2|nr:hypothetical protein CONCODRAFT_13241 [Conidiobolus coronatus NRRL 28638]|eukprot:KXN65240.1 hypothetical protein CONCODRAFT_13241 [Conidiobolus coronatus NRRL 28638]